MIRPELVALSEPREARWELPAARTKARRAHVVPLSPRALDVVTGALARRETDRDEAGSVFASRFESRSTLARHSLSQGLARVIERIKPAELDADAAASLKADPPTPHDLRRTVATGLARLGMAREDRLAVLGHAADDVHGKHYDKYARLREKRVALQTWERHLARVLGQEPVETTVVPMTRRRS
jgi:integrase